MTFLIDHKVDVQILVRTYGYDHPLQIRGLLNLREQQTFLYKIVPPGTRGWVGRACGVTSSGAGPTEIEITVKTELDGGDQPKLQNLESGEVRFDHFGGLDVQWVDFVDEETGDLIVRVYLFELDEGD